MGLGPAEPDVVVVGAGPAGSATAIVLARAGMSVLMVDRSTFPRDKPCGDLVLPRAAEVLSELGIFDMLDDALIVRQQRSVSAEDLDRRHDGERGRGVWMLPRRVFDARLVQHARESGATLLHGRLVGLAQPVEAGPVVTIRPYTDGTFHAGELTLRPRYVVGADGATSQVAKLVGARHHAPEDQAFALRRYARADSAVLGDHIDFIVGLEAFGTGREAYAWVFPTSPTTANVGVCQWGPDPGKGAAAALDELFATLPTTRPDLPTLTPISRAIGGFIRFDAPEVRRVIDKVVLVGDAAGLSQPSSGEGISFALRSGVLAGQAIAAEVGGSGNLDAYDSAVSRDLLPRLAAGLDQLAAGRTVASVNLQVERSVQINAEGSATGPGAGEPDARAGTEILHRSDGVSVANLGDQVVAVDEEAAVVHVVEGTPGWLLYGLPTTADAMVDEMLGYADVPASEVRSMVATALEWLEAKDLVGRRGGTTVVGPWPGSPLAPDDRLVGLAHPALDARIAFRSNDADLLATLDDLFAGGLPGVVPTHWLDVDRDDQGGVTVTGAHEWRLSSGDEQLERIVDIVNEYATRTFEGAVLRAGAVRAPSGEVWILLGDDDVDTSPLTAALLQAGCDFLGSGSIGIRARTLDAVAFPTPVRLDGDGTPALARTESEAPLRPARAARADVDVLHGDHGPVRALLLVDDRPDRPATARRLANTEALQALLVNTPNLARVGDRGLQSLCDLVSKTTAVRVTHHDAPALARILVAEGPSALGDDLDHDLRCERRRLSGGTAIAPRHGAIGDIYVRRAPDVDWATIEADGAPAAVIRSPSKPACGLTGPALSLWLRVESAITFEDLVRSTAEDQGGRDDRAAQDLAWLLSQFANNGLLALDGGGQSTATFTQLAEQLAPDGPTEAVSPSILSARCIPTIRGDLDAAGWGEWASTATTRDVAGVRVVTDHPEIRRAMEAIGRSPALGAAAAAASESRPHVEARTLPGTDNGVVIRCETRLDWYPPDAVLSSTALAISSCRNALNVTPLASLPPAPARRLVVDDQGRLLIEDHETARAWLLAGADPDLANGFGAALQGASLVMDERDSELVMWVEAIELSASRSGGSRPPLLLLLAPNHVGPLAEGEHEGTVEVEVDLAAELRSTTIDPNRPEPTTSVADRPKVAVRHGGHPLPDGRHRTGTIASWASRWGEISYGDASAKVSASGITVGRPLVSVSFAERREDLPPLDDAAVQRIGEACAEIEMPQEWTSECARAAASAGAFFVGEQLGRSDAWRRKFYVNEPSEGAWRWLRDRWPDHLTDPPRLPSWVAWKWSNDLAAAPERSIEFGRLGGAATVREEVEPMLDSMGPDWSEVVRHLLSPLHLDDASTPLQGDCLTVDEGGRRTVDLTVRARNGHVVLGELEPELRWLSAVAGHDRAAADELVTWAWTGRLSVLIFGTDGHGQPFVNFYISQP